MLYLIHVLVIGQHALGRLNHPTVQRDDGWGGRLLNKFSALRPDYKGCVYMPGRSQNATRTVFLSYRWTTAVLHKD